MKSPKVLKSVVTTICQCLILHYSYYTISIYCGPGNVFVGHSASVFFLILQREMQTTQYYKYATMHCILWSKLVMFFVMANDIMMAIIELYKNSYSQQLNLSFQQ